MGGRGLVVTDTLSQTPWIRHSVHWWLPGEVQDRGKEEAYYSVFRQETFPGPVAGYEVPCNEEDLEVGLHTLKTSNDGIPWGYCPLFCCGIGRINPRAGQLRFEDMVGQEMYTSGPANIHQAFGVALSDSRGNRSSNHEIRNQRSMDVMSQSMTYKNIQCCLHAYTLLEHRPLICFFLLIWPAAEVVECSLAPSFTL